MLKKWYSEDTILTHKNMVFVKIKTAKTRKRKEWMQLEKDWFVQSCGGKALEVMCSAGRFSSTNISVLLEHLEQIKRFS